MSFVLDTNAIIYYVNGDTDAISVLSPILENEMIIVPSIVVTELWSSAKATRTEMHVIATFLDSTLIMPLDNTLGKVAGELRRDYRLSLGDSVIAATTLAIGATLLTRNVRDFKRVPSLVIQPI
ncbi:MAG: type II toxin-antitoxin system VapC family toxin [Patescibacteria group bacterium]